MTTTAHDSKHAGGVTAISRWLSAAIPPVAASMSPGSPRRGDTGRAIVPSVLPPLQGGHDFLGERLQPFVLPHQLFGVVAPNGLFERAANRLTVGVLRYIEHFEVIEVRQPRMPLHDQGGHGAGRQGGAALDGVLWTRWRAARGHVACVGAARQRQ